jgi:hypothetical protein
MDNLPLPKKDELIVYVSNAYERIIIALHPGTEPTRIYSSNLHRFSIEILNYYILHRFNSPTRGRQHLKYVINVPGSDYRVVNHVRRFSTELLPQIEVYNLIDTPWITNQGEILI